MTKKKLLSLLMAAVVSTGAVVTFTACGDTNTPAEPTVEGIEITTAPTTTHYVVGQTFDTAGMVVSKVWSNNEKEAVTDYTYSPTGALKLTDKKVTVTWGEYSCTQNITVTNDIVSHVVKSDATKTTYLTGDKFDPTGLVVEYTDEKGDKYTVDAGEEDSPISFSTAPLKGTDTKFAISYLGYSFDYDLTIKYGSFVEAEDTILIATERDGLANNGPCDQIITNFITGAYSEKVEAKYIPVTGNYDTWKAMTDEEKAELDFSAIEATGGYVKPDTGTRIGAHVALGNNDALITKYNADKAGNVTLKLDMTNPFINGCIATETALNTFCTIKVNGQEVTIPDEVKVAGVDWTEYGTEKRPKFAWQDVSVDIPFIAGDNSVYIQFHDVGSTSYKEVYLDSISFDSDANKISLSTNAVMERQAKSAIIEVKEDKVYMGLIVSVDAVMYNDAEIITVLEKTKVKLSNQFNQGFMGAGEDGYGKIAWIALGYPTNCTNETWWDATLVPESAEKITEGKYAGDFKINYEVTQGAKGTGKAVRYFCAYMVNGIGCGQDWSDSAKKTTEAVLMWTDDTMTTLDTTHFGENNGVTYQVSRDVRDDNNTFANGALMLVVQEGSFAGDNPVHLLGRRKLSLPGIQDYPEDWPWIEEAPEAPAE